MPEAFRFLLPLLAVPLLAQGAEVAVRVDRSGDGLHVDASAEFDGTIAGTWRVLTDYGRLAEFIPDVHSSRVVARKGNVAHVEQTGETRLLFLRYPMNVRFEITEHPYERIVSRAVAGRTQQTSASLFILSRQGNELQVLQSTQPPAAPGSISPSGSGEGCRPRPRS